MYRALILACNSKFSSHRVGITGAPAGRESMNALNSDGEGNTPGAAPADNSLRFCSSSCLARSRLAALMRCADVTPSRRGRSRGHVLVDCWTLRRREGSCGVGRSGVDGRGEEV